MKLVPNTIAVDGTWLRAYNGDPALARDAAEADRLAVHLAIGRRCHPVILGTAMEAGLTYEWRSLIPPYTTAVGFSLLVSGQGDVTLTCDNDTYDCVVPVQTGGTTRTDAVWMFVDEPKTVSANGYWRCLEPGEDTSPVERGFTVTCSGSAKVWAILTRPLPRADALA